MAGEHTIRRLRILVDAVSGRSGGGTVRVRELANSFRSLRLGHQYLFVVQESLAALVRERVPSAEILSPPAIFDRPPARLFWEHVVLPRSVHSWAPDVVFSPFNVLPTRWPSPQPRLALIVSNLQPYSPDVRQMYRGRAQLRLEMLKRLTDRSIARADRVFLLSPQALNLIQESSLPSKAELIPMAPPNIPPVAVIDPEVREPYFLVASDLLRFKGVEQIVRALALLPGRSQPLVLVCGRFVERGYVRQLQEEIRARGLQGRVHLVGRTDHDHLLSLMAGCRACIVPSRFENLSRVPAEAMAMGVPVIASSILSSHEACGEAALYFPLDDVRTLSSHLQRLLVDDGIWSELTRKGTTHIAGMSSDDASGRILRSLEDLAGL